MKDRIDGLKPFLPPEQITILESLYSDYLLATQTSKSGKTSDVKLMLNKKSNLEKSLALFEDGVYTSTLESVKEVIDYISSLGYAAPSDRTIYSHIDKGLLIRADDKTFKKSDVEQYAKKNLFTSVDKETDESLKQAQLKQMTARTSLTELKLAKEQGMVIETDKIDTEFAARIEEMKRLHEEIIESLPLLLVGKAEDDIRNLLKDRYDYILSTYARKLEVLKGSKS